MLDQVLQSRVDQQMMALIGAIRSAVSGSTGLSQGQTAMAVVQVPETAAPQNQNSGGGGASSGQSGQPSQSTQVATNSGSTQASGQNPAQASGQIANTSTQATQTPAQAAQISTQASPMPAQVTHAAAQAQASVAAATNAVLAQASAAQATAQSTVAQSTTAQTATQATVQAQTAAIQTAAQTQVTAQTNSPQTAQNNTQATPQTAAQALVNQVNAQTAATLAAALANATSGLTNTAGATRTAGTVLNQLSNLLASPTATPQPTASTTSVSSTLSAASAPVAAGSNTNIHSTGNIPASNTPQPTAASAAQTALSNQNLSIRVMIPQTGQTVELTQIKPLPAGTQMMLRQSGGDHVDILKIQLPPQIQTKAASTTVVVNEQALQKAALQQTTMSALREALPLQKPVTETLTTLQSLLPQLPSAVRDNPIIQQALQTIEKATLKLSSESAPSAQTVKQGVQRSGVFHEAVMMQALQQASAAPQGAPIAAVGDDLKGAFFQIFRQLTRGGSNAERGQDSSGGNRGNVDAADSKQSTQGQLVRSLQEGLARVRSNQLQSSPAARGADQGAATQGVQTDLPIMFNSQLSEVKVKIEQEIWPEDQQPTADEDYQRRWVINLSFAPPELGQLHARLLYQGEKLSTHLWVEEDSHLPNVSKQLHELKERLNSLGIVVEEVRCQAGKPESKPQPGLVSLKA
ncbi:flagellar hook-length control protein FliK [Oceanospirillum maris]|uniref:flagellar hook-length control protein FliK n=1 Tax=Oceanospirillum maris TaxID=64977 RepID=UPI00042458C1|nr:flagellar hook-length control protein FliK [Oceanospirillum maris]